MMCEKHERNQKCAMLWKSKEGLKSQCVRHAIAEGGGDAMGNPHQEGRSSLVACRRGEARCPKLWRGF